MKCFLLFALPAIAMMPANNVPRPAPRTAAVLDYSAAGRMGNSAGFQLQPGYGTMPAVVFKNQKFCRVEPAEDCNFDVHFTIVSANVYFSGANFTVPQKGTISGNDLKPLQALMNQCTAGSVVVFEEIKVQGPGTQIRTIEGAAYLLK